MIALKIRGIKTYRLSVRMKKFKFPLQSAGHYYGYVGNYYCNDGIVTQPSPEQRWQDSQQAYLLLYSLQ